MKGERVKSHICLLRENKLEVLQTCCKAQLNYKIEMSSYAQTLSMLSFCFLSSFSSGRPEMMRFSCIQCWCWCEINSTGGGESQLSNSTIPIVPRLTKYNIIQTWLADYLDFTLYCTEYWVLWLLHLMIETHLKFKYWNCFYILSTTYYL